MTAPADTITRGAGYRPRARVLLCELRERTSERAGRYVTGWLGRANIIGFEGRDDQDNVVWRIFVEPGAGAGR